MGASLKEAFLKLNEILFAVDFLNVLVVEGLFFYKVKDCFYICG